MGGVILLSKIFLRKVDEIILLALETLYIRIQQS